LLVKSLFYDDSGGNPQEPAPARNSLLALESSLSDNFDPHKFVFKDCYPMSPTTSINHLPPERMTLEQRRLEIASILAKGLVRLRQSGPAHLAQRQIAATDRKVLLGFSGDQSVHTDLINK
jgi:hypothetical protein